jgi:hypothetical protein
MGDQLELNGSACRMHCVGFGPHPGHAGSSEGRNNRQSLLVDMRCDQGKRKKAQVTRSAVSLCQSEGHFM